MIHVKFELCNIYHFSTKNVYLVSCNYSNKYFWNYGSLHYSVTN